MNKSVGTKPQTVGRASPRAANKDRLSAEHRSWNMSRIRGKDTTPERIVRSLLHRLGCRFRLHVRIPIKVGRVSPLRAVGGKTRKAHKRVVMELKSALQEKMILDYDCLPLPLADKGKGKLLNE